MATEWKAHYRQGDFSSVALTRQGYTQLPRQGYTQLKIFNTFKAIVPVDKAIKCA